MLPKKNRADRKTVENIFKTGRFVNSQNLSLKFILDPLALQALPLSRGREVRISFIAPKTASKKAVDRNLLRRRGYAVLKKYFKKFPAGFSGAFVFGKKSMEVFGGRKLARRGGSKNYNPINNLEKEIENILNKIN